MHKECGFLLLIFCSAIASIYGHVEINICTDSNGTINLEKGGWAPAIKKTWTFRGDDGCLDDKSSLVLKQRSCTSSVTMSGDRSGNFPLNNICALSPGTCLLLLSFNVTSIDVGIIEGCKSVAVVQMNRVFPQNVTFSEPFTFHSVKFDMEYTYLSFEVKSNTSTSIANSTSLIGTADVSTTIEGKTTGYTATSYMPTTYTSNMVSIKTSVDDERTLPETSRRPETDRGFAEYCETCIIIIAVLCGLILAAIIALAILARIIHGYKTKPERIEAEAPQGSQNTSDALYAEVKKPRKTEESSEREIVINAIYQASS